MNKTRCFSFGCSYTSFCWATWADLIGSNFETYTNFGREGASNTFIMNSVFEANDKVKFNSETDYIVVMFTGISRFSYINKQTKSWTLWGNIRNIPKDNPEYLAISNFVDNIWNESWAVYQTWIAVKAVKEFLTSKQLKHKILMGMDNSYYKTNADMLELDPNDVKKMENVYNMLDIKESLDEFIGPNRQHVYFKENSMFDDHPSQHHHFQFMSKYFPEFVTPVSNRMFQEVELVFENTSQDKQRLAYKKLMNNFNIKTT